MWAEASPDDRHPCTLPACSCDFKLVNPHEQMRHAHERMAHHQYAMLLGIQALRGRVTMLAHTDNARHVSKLVSARYGVCKSRHVKSNLYQPKGKK